MRMISLPLLSALIVALTLPGAGCGPSRAFSTASPDVTTDKHQSQLTGDGLTLHVPDAVDVSYEGEVPSSVTIHGNVVMSLIGAQSHSADSQHDMQGTIEAVNQLRELFGLEATLDPGP